MTLTRQQIAGLRELLAKATQYPAWGGWPDPQPSRHGTDHYTIGDASPYLAAVRRKEDAELIAAMHRALPALLDIAEAVMADALDRKIELGVMVMKDGKAWGITYEDGHSTSYGWMSPAEAPMHDARYCRKPTDVTYAGSYLIPELEKGEIVPVERVIEVFATAVLPLAGEVAK